MTRIWVMGRLRLAFLLLSPVVVLVLIAVAVSLVALGSLGSSGESPTEAGLARIGDDVALVIVTGGQPEATQNRTLIANWGLVAPAVVLIVASLGSWWLSGRVDTVRETAATADRDRETRLQDVVHELRTPLAVMGTNLELAGKDKYIEAARRAVYRMARTVDDLAGHGRLVVDGIDEQADFALLAEEIATEHAGPGQSLGIQLELVGFEPVNVDGVDPVAVRTALGNFMSNALRASPRGSRVTIDWGEHHGWAWLSVSDEGSGLAPRLHARAFERGWQGAYNRDRRLGSGLGLTIARQLTEAHGGFVTVESEEGGGAVFAIWLPVTADADKTQIVASDGVHPVSSPWAKRKSPTGL